MDEKKLCECITRATRAANLVAGRTLLAVPGTAGTAVKIDLAALRGEHTRAFAIQIKARDTLTGEDAAVLQYLINPPGGDDITAAALLTAGAGQYLLAGTERVHSAAPWAKDLVIESAGVDEADFSTAAPVVFTVHVTEMVSVEEPERC